MGAGCAAPAALGANGIWGSWHQDLSFWGAVGPRVETQGAGLGAASCLPEPPPAAQCHPPEGETRFGVSLQGGVGRELGIPLRRVASPGRSSRTDDGSWVSAGAGDVCHEDLLRIPGEIILAPPDASPEDYELCSAPSTPPLQRDSNPSGE